jgi:hypothetical protein
MADIAEVTENLDHVARSLDELERENMAIAREPTDRDLQKQAVDFRAKVTELEGKLRKCEEEAADEDGDATVRAPSLHYHACLSAHTQI